MKPQANQANRKMLLFAGKLHCFLCHTFALFFPFSFTIKGEEEKKEQKKVCSFTLFIVRKEKKRPFLFNAPVAKQKKQKSI
jgi:hypothetical protein